MTRRFLILLSAIILNIDFQTSLAQDVDLVPYKKDSLWGYADFNKKIVIEPKFSFAEPFHFDLAYVGIENKFALIDSSGKYLIFPQESQLKYYPPYNLIRKCRNCCSFSYTNKKDEVIIGEKYKKLSDVCDGFVVAETDSAYFLINNKGKVVKQLDYDKIWLAYIGPAIYPDRTIEVKKNKKKGYIKCNGDEIIAPIYDYISYSSDKKHFLVRSDSNTGLINTEGKWIIPIKCQRIDNIFNENTFLTSGSNGCSVYIIKPDTVLRYDYDSAWVGFNNYALVIKNGKMGLIDDKLKLVIPTKYDNIMQNIYDKSYVVKQNGKTGLLSKDFKEIIPAQFDSIWEFDDKLLRITKNGRVGLVDKKGKILIEPEYDKIDHSLFPGNLIVGKGDKYGMIDSTNKVLIPIKYQKDSTCLFGTFHYDVNETYKDSIIKAQFYCKTGYLNKYCIEVIPFKYDYIEDFVDGFAIVTISKKRGLIDTKGKEVVPVEYFNITRINKKIIRVDFSNDKSGYYDIYGKKYFDD